MLCAVIETNVIVSAFLKWDSIPGQVLQAVFDGSVIPVFNDEILNEYELVLNRDKFHFPKNLLKSMLEQIKILGVLESDSVALAHGKTSETHLVTGNTKHFPAVPIVVTPKEFLEKLEQNNTTKIP